MCMTYNRLNRLLTEGLYMDEGHNMLTYRPQFQFFRKEHLTCEIIWLRRDPHCGPAQVIMASLSCQSPGATENLSCRGAD
ncbi:hypothetical protein TNCV_2499481 [Trichonephila clavipes]|nr:hypothetical protein TNCV_2499481 [Trichonephila clavipes]